MLRMVPSDAAPFPGPGYLGAPSGPHARLRPGFLGPPGARSFDSISAGCQGPRRGTPALAVPVGGLPWAWPKSEWR